MAAQIETLLGRLNGVKKTGQGKWLAKCPAHDDRSPSLGVKFVDDKVLIHCFAGCSVDDVLQSIGLQIDDLFPERAARSGTPRPQAPRFSPYELFPLLVQEAMILALAFDDAVCNRDISDADFLRAQQAFAAVYRLHCEVSK